MTRKTFRVLDLPVALGLVALFVILPFAGGGDAEPRRLEITLEADKLGESLTPDRVLALPGPLGDTVVELSGGRVRITQSPCPNKLCIRTGWIDRYGQAVVCLPNKVALTLSGQETEGVDAVAR